MPSMSVTSYFTIATDGDAEIEVERSRFRATLARVEGEFGARSVIEQVRKEHFDAGHHCSAYVIGPDRSLERSSDDGEPSGTGGAPILQVLRGQQVSDVVVVVTRWFGGTLLGTGRLSRAYADVARAGLEAAGLVERVLLDLCTVSVAHASVGRLEHALRSRGAIVLGVEYADQAQLRIAVPPSTLETAAEIVSELTGGTALMQRVGERWVDR